MNVVRHHYGRMQIVFLSIAVNAAVQDDGSRPPRQDQAAFGDECDEVGRVVFLYVGQIAPIESHDS